MKDEKWTNRFLEFYFTTNKAKRYTFYNENVRKEYNLTTLEENINSVNTYLVKIQQSRIEKIESLIERLMASHTDMLKYYHFFSENKEEIINCCKFKISKSLEVLDSVGAINSVDKLPIILDYKYTNRIIDNIESYAYRIYYLQNEEKMIQTALDLKKWRNKKAFELTNLICNGDYNMNLIFGDVYKRKTNFYTLIPKNKLFSPYKLFYK